jgi:hypothetical protein
MRTAKASAFSLFAGIVFTAGGLLTIWSGRLRSATVPEFHVGGLSARVIGALFLIMGVVLLFDWIKKKRGGARSVNNRE